MAYHILGHKDWQEDFTVMDKESVVNKLRKDSARARPSLNGLFLPGLVHFRSEDVV